MAVAYRGNAGASGALIYTTPPGGPFSLQSIRFTLTTDATAGVHRAQVTITDNSGVIVQTLRDWNEAGPSMTITYTFGIGLISSACTLVTGEAVEHDLVQTVLAPNTKINVTSVNAAGATIAGDQVGAPVLYGDYFDETDTAPAASSLRPVRFLPAPAAP